jgi:hypothetical protein
MSEQITEEQAKLSVEFELAIKDMRKQLKQYSKNELVQALIESSLLTMQLKAELSNIAANQKGES